MFDSSAVNVTTEIMPLAHTVFQQILSWTSFAIAGVLLNFKSIQNQCWSCFQHPKVILLPFIFQTLQHPCIVHRKQTELSAEPCGRPPLRGCISDLLQFCKRTRGPCCALHLEFPFFSIVFHQLTLTPTSSSGDHLFPKASTDAPTTVQVGFLLSLLPSSFQWNCTCPCLGPCPHQCE